MLDMTTVILPEYIYIYICMVDMTTVILPGVYIYIYIYIYMYG